MPRIWPGEHVPGVWSGKPVPMVCPEKAVTRLWTEKVVPRIWPLRKPVPRACPWKLVSRVCPRKAVPGFLHVKSCAQGLSMEICAQVLSMETCSQCFAIESCERPRIGTGEAAFGICPDKTVEHLKENAASTNERKLIHVSILQVELWNNKNKRIIGLRFNIMLLLLMVRIYYVVTVCLNKNIIVI